MSKHIQGVSYKELAVVGGSDDLERYIFRLISEDDWEIPDRFYDDHSLWNLLSQDLEFQGYVLVLEDHDAGEDGGPGSSFGHYGLRLEKPKDEVRDFARRLIIDACKQ